MRPCHPSRTNEPPRLDTELTGPNGPKETLTGSNENVWLTYASKRMKADRLNASSWLALTDGSPISPSFGMWRGRRGSLAACARARLLTTPQSNNRGGATSENMANAVPATIDPRWILLCLRYAD